MTRLIVANLDCEAEWAGAPPPPAPVVAMLAALGTLRRAELPDGDGAAAIELVAGVDPARVVGPGPRPALVARGRHAIAAREVDVWGATAAWPTPPVTVEVARRASDRRLAHAVAAALGGAPDGAAVVGSLDELAARLPGAVAASPSGTWVAKATICAAGRDRVRRRGAALDGATRTRLARLLARGGALVLEPWLDRIADLGQPGEVDARGDVIVGAPHRLHVDDAGGFRGIAVGADPVVAAHAGALAEAARAAGRAIAQVGYRGPFAIDAFVHRDGAAERLRPLVEINPRRTFGHVARAWAARLGDGALAVGRGAPPVGAISLVEAGDGDPTAAWFTPRA